MTEEQVIRCSECAAPIREDQERCNYCGYWFKPHQEEEIGYQTPLEKEIHNVSDIASTGIEVMIAFILAAIASIIGLNLIPAVAKAITHP